MNREPCGGVVVIVAAVDGGADVAANLRRFVLEVEGRGRVVLLDATSGRTASHASRAFDDLEVIECQTRALAPELWAEGIRDSSEPYIALTTSEMTPKPGWLDAILRRLDQTGSVAVGGPIEPAFGLRAVDRAVYLLRYLRYHSPLQDQGEPAGDNAVYRRDAIERLAAFEGTNGFWESPVHRELRDRGETISIDSEASVIFQGGARLAPLLRQRFLHAWHYGSGRAERFGLGEKLARTVLTPLVPCVLLARIVANVVAKKLRLLSWLPAFPALVLLLAAWTLGEAVGLWRLPSKPTEKQVDTPSLVHVQG